MRLLATDKHEKTRMTLKMVAGKGAKEVKEKQFQSFKYAKQKGSEIEGSHWDFQLEINTDNT